MRRFQRAWHSAEYTVSLFADHTTASPDDAGLSFSQLDLSWLARKHIGGLKSQMLSEAKWKVARKERGSRGKA